MTSQVKDRQYWQLVLDQLSVQWEIWSAYGRMSHEFEHASDFLDDEWNSRPDDDDATDECIDESSRVFGPCFMRREWRFDLDLSALEELA